MRGQNFTPVPTLHPKVRPRPLLAPTAFLPPTPHPRNTHPHTLTVPANCVPIPSSFMQYAHNVSPSISLI